MRLVPRELAEHFGLPLPNITSFIARVLDRAVDDGELVMEEAPVREVILRTLAEIAAACRSCSKPFERGATQCQCGRSLGRCPACSRCTSFSVVKTHWFSRDDYRCDSCGAGVVKCIYREAEHCYGWTAGDSYCVTCVHDPVRLRKEAESDREREQFARQAFQTGMQSAMKDSPPRTAQQDRQWEEVRDMVFTKKK